MQRAPPPSVGGDHVERAAEALQPHQLRQQRATFSGDAHATLSLQYAAPKHVLQQQVIAAQVWSRSVAVSSFEVDLLLRVHHQLGVGDQTEIEDQRRRGQKIFGSL